MLAGTSTASTASSGSRKTAISTKVTATIARALRLARNGQAMRNAIAMISPDAAAARPAKARRTIGRSLNCP